MASTSGDPMFTSVPGTVPQFSGGGPPVLVRNTFIDIDDRPPTPEALKRAETAPPAPGRRQEGSSSEDEAQQATEPERTPEHLITRDWYERADEWRWANASTATSASASTTLPAAVDPYQASSDEPGLPDVMLPMGTALQPPLSGSDAWQGIVQPDRSARRPGPSSPSGSPLGPTLPAEGMAVPPQPQTLQREISMSSQHFRFNWTVDARKLKGNDKQAVSPAFDLSFGPAFPSATFKMILYPKGLNDTRGGGSFKKARGVGYVQLKCEADIPEAIANVSFRLGIGSAANRQPMRGPVLHNFASSAVCGLPKAEEEWDLTSVVDEASLTFVVCLEIVSPSTCQSVA